MISFPALNIDNEAIVNVTGAGDSCSSGLIAGLVKGYDLKFAILNGLLAAKYALMTHMNISTKLGDIDLDLLKKISVENESFLRIKKMKLN